MSSEAYASLLEASGHRVVRTTSTWWYEAHPRWYLSVPIHSPLTPGPDEFREVFSRGAWVIRYPCPVSAGARTYLTACDSSDYGLLSLSATARRATRRGLERCTVRRISFSDLEPNGALELSRETLQRQHRKVPDDHDRYWRQHFEAAGRNSSAECWGAFARGRLVSFLTAVTVGSSVYLLLLKSSREHLSDYPNNAVVYSLTRDALGRGGVKEVTWGLEPLLPSLGGLERFKQGMGFQHRPIGQRIEVKPPMDVALRGPAAWGLAKIEQRWGSGQTVGRASAVLRIRSQQPRSPVRSG